MLVTQHEVDNPYLSPSFSPSLPTQLAVIELLSIVNTSIGERNDNAKSDIAATLLSGKALIRLKNIVNYGNWGVYIVENTDYKTVRQAQHDMKFYRVWQHIIDERFDGSIDVFVSNLSNTDVASCKTAMVLFTNGDIPRLAFELSVEDIKEQGLNIRSAETVIALARAIQLLPSKEDMVIAKRWYITYDVRSVAILQAIPKLRVLDDLFDAIDKTGYIEIPAIDNGETRQIALSEAGHTDIELALQNVVVERALQEQQLRLERYIGRNVISHEETANTNTITVSPSDHIVFPDSVFLGNGEQNSEDAIDYPNEDAARISAQSNEIIDNSEAVTPLSTLSIESLETSLSHVDTLAPPMATVADMIEVFDWMMTRKGNKTQLLNQIQNYLEDDVRYKIIVYVESE